MKKFGASTGRATLVERMHTVMIRSLVLFGRDFNNNNKICPLYKMSQQCLFSE